MGTSEPTFVHAIARLVTTLFIEPIPQPRKESKNEHQYDYVLKNKKQPNIKHFTYWLTLFVTPVETPSEASSSTAAKITASQAVSIRTNSACASIAGAEAVAPIVNKIVNRLNQANSLNTKNFRKSTEAETANHTDAHSIR